MKTIAISGSLRENVGKRDAKELRYEGKVPAVLYGGNEQVHFAITRTDLNDAIYSPEANFLEITVDGKAVKAIVKDAQFHPLTDLLIHVDFLQLFDEKEITMEIPVKLAGTSPGVKMGGKLVQKLRKLRVKALPKNMPQVVEVSIAKLEVGNLFRVRDLQKGEYSVTNTPEDTIVSVGMSRALKQAENEAKGKKNKIHCGFLDLQDKMAFQYGMPFLLNEIIKNLLCTLPSAMYLLLHEILIVGLGNIGAEYVGTRHNIGFDIADELVAAGEGSFEHGRLAYHAEVSHKGKKLHVIKPTTYMNLSGKAVNYWMKELKILPENVLVLVDDLALPLGKLRMKLQGSSAGHNGLKSIEEVCGGQNYARLRFGIGDDFPKGRQVDFVLGQFDKNEKKELPVLINRAVSMIKSFATIGAAQTMTLFNK